MNAVFVAVVCALSAPLVFAKMCPGGGQSCASRMTCCELPTGKQGCCPYENATCCPDKVHCCPDGFYCLSDHCQKRDEDEVVGITKLMVNYDESENEVMEEYQSTNASVTSNICPDGSQCGDQQTCCKVSPSHYGCCPMDHAVCCRDMKTCCPHGTRCTGRGQCESTEDEVQPVKAIGVNTICPGGTEQCPAGDTCCPRPSGHYGCCPMLAATCCAGGMYCCPHGYRCDGRGQCYLGN